MDVEALFQKHTLSELKDVEKKLRTDVERKKEELRELVSQRYRDLLDAADQIKGMHVSIANVMTQLKLCQAKESPVTSPASSINRESSLTTNKSLVELNSILDYLLPLVPAIIFKSLDDSTPLAGALLFTFVRNIVWQRSAENPGLPEDPRWGFIRVYSDFISQCVHAQFERINYEEGELLGYFAATIVLNSSTTKLDTLRAFLAVRTRVFRELLTTSSTLTCKEIFRLSLLSVLETIRGVYEIFNQVGDINAHIRNSAEIIRDRILLDILRNRGKISGCCLDGIIVSVSSSEDTENSKQAAQTLSSWLDNTLVAEIAENLDKALSLIPSIQSISDINLVLTATLVEEDRKTPSLTKAQKELGLPTLKVIDLYRNSVRTRFRSLIRERTAAILQEIERQLDGDHPTASVVPKNKFVSSMTGVHAKADGSRSRIKFPGIKQINTLSPGSSSHYDSVTFVASQLVKLRMEIKQTEASNAETGSTWMMEDAQKAFFEMISALLPLVQIRLANTSSTHKSTYSFFCSLITHKAFALDDSVSRFSEGVERELDACVFLIFNDWLVKTLDRWMHLTLHSLKENQDPARWSLDTPPFQKNSIEERNDVGEMVKYTVTVPWRASVSCHVLLKSLHDELIGFMAGSGRVPFTDAAIKQIFLAIAQCYSDYAENIPATTTKNQALQIIFDVKLISAFGKRRKLLATVTLQMLQKTVDKISALVDPIDYHVLLPFLDQNVLAHVAAVQNLYFSLTFLDVGLASDAAAFLNNSDSLNAKSGANSLQNKSVWFSPLPLNRSISK